MNKSIRLVCNVAEVRPRGLFVVCADGGRSFQAALMQVGRPSVRLAVGDLVLVLPSQSDLTRARILEKLFP